MDRLLRRSRSADLDSPTSPRRPLAATPVALASAASTAAATSASPPAATFLGAPRAAAGE